jgi:glucose/mannose transport system substrate-binding protein
VDNAKAWLKLAGTKAAQESFNAQKGSICARTDCDYNKGFNDYLKSAASDWGKDRIVPSVVHGAAAGPKLTKAYGDALVLFAANGDVAKAQAALVGGAEAAGFAQ